MSSLFLTLHLISSYLPVLKPKQILKTDGFLALGMACPGCFDESQIKEMVNWQNIWALSFAVFFWMRLELRNIIN